LKIYKLLKQKTQETSLKYSNINVVPVREECPHLVVMGRQTIGQLLQNN